MYGILLCFCTEYYHKIHDNIPLMELLMIVDYKTIVTDRDLVCLSLEQSVIL